MARREERNLARRKQRAAAVSSSGSSWRSGSAKLHTEEIPNLGPVLVNRRDKDVRRLVVGKLNDQLREIGLDRLDPGCT
jgi:hypothetical protein